MSSITSKCTRAWRITGSATGLWWPATIRDVSKLVDPTTNSCLLNTSVFRLIRAIGCSRCSYVSEWGNWSITRCTWAKSSPTSIAEGESPSAIDVGEEVAEWIVARLTAFPLSLAARCETVIANYRRLVVVTRLRGLIGWTHCRAYTKSQFTQRFIDARQTNKQNSCTETIMRQKGSCRMQSRSHMLGLNNPITFSD